MRRVRLTKGEKPFRGSVDWSVNLISRVFQFAAGRAKIDLEIRRERSVGQFLAHNS